MPNTKPTPDYTVTMMDPSGLRSATLHINGAEIDEKIADGYSRAEAVETSESNQFEKAIADGRITADAYLWARSTDEANESEGA